jgi:hypothetical protein
MTRLQIIIPGQQGLFGFADAGRVYVQNDQVASPGTHVDQFHTSFGGGVWMSFINRGNVLYVGMGKPTKDKEGTRVIAGFGFPF